MVSSTPRPHFTPGKDTVPILEEAGWTPGPVWTGGKSIIRRDVYIYINEQRNILHEIRKREANWIGHILRRNCLLQQVIEGKIKGQI